MYNPMQFSNLVWYASIFSLPHTPVAKHPFLQTFLLLPVVFTSCLGVHQEAKKKGLSNLLSVCGELQGRENILLERNSEQK